MQGKWQMYRTGLINFWYYDEEEFHLANGKLLLRGSNGSGKSVTMQSLIPLLLDGRKSPDRLDPFGSRARRIEDYLLGEKDLVNRDERTGYLYLEYKRENTDQYLTTGMGLQAKSHGPLDSWGFIIHDNRRVSRDLFLYKTEYDGHGKKQKIPLSRRELENLLGDGGKVVQTQGEYMELVNRYVFGFESLEAYEDLVKLLIQLRSPKLSKEFKPTVIYEILNDSLPALADDELRPLSDTIENMDQTKQQLEQLLKDQSSLTRICKQYDLYNQFVLAEKAQGLLQSQKRAERLNRQTRELEAKLGEMLRQETMARDELLKRELEQTVLQEEAVKLREHDVFRAEADKRRLEEELASGEHLMGRKAATLEQKKQSELRFKKSLEEQEARRASLENRTKELVAALESLADAAGFADHFVAANGFRHPYEEGFSFDIWRQDMAAYQQRLDQGLRFLRAEGKAKERYHESDKDLANARMELNNARETAHRWGEMFEEERSNWLAGFHRWRESNAELALEDTEIQSISQRLMTIYDESRFADIQDIAFQAYNRHYQALEKAAVQNRHKLELQNTQIATLKEELQELRQAKDMEPERHPETTRARAKLEASGIPHLPFFAAVEFKEDVDIGLRERLEAAIMHMGLLDALILPGKYLNEAPLSDRIIRPRRLPKYGTTTLADLLYPTPIENGKVSAKDIEAVLAGIVVNLDAPGVGGQGETGTHQMGLDFAAGTGSTMLEAELAEGVTVLDTRGFYHMGPLHGHAPKMDEAMYIGKEARRRLREREMGRLQLELDEAKARQVVLEGELKVLGARQEELVAEYEAFPPDTDLGEAYLNLEKASQLVEACLRDVERRNEKLKSDLKEWQLARERVREHTTGLQLTVTEEAFEDAKGEMQSYAHHFQVLQLTHKDYLNAGEQMSHLGEALQDVAYDVDELQGEINVLKGELAKLVLQLGQAEERLRELGAEEIQAKIAEVVKRLSELPQQIKGLTQRAEKARFEANTTREALTRNAVEVATAGGILALWEKTLREDIRLVKGFYSPREVPEATGAEETSEQSSMGRRSSRLLHFLEDGVDSSDARSLAQVARSIMDEYGGLITQKNLDRSQVSDSLNRVYYREQALLLEYGLTQEALLELTELPDVTADEVTRTLLGEVQEKSRRVQLLMDYGGKKVSPYFVSSQVERDIMVQQSVLNDQDRELYEEIIMHSVGRIIRARINRAEKWVAKIDELMGERDASSGLTFSLNWRPRPAECEEELDTRDLVDLLRSDPRLLREEDMQRVTKHFRSRIERAKSIQEDRGLGYTLHQAIRDVLDYRQWFAFRLQYQRAGEPKRELTNNAFYKLSGGEKAMAMYIPLFSAAYSRYLEARKDAPFIISLDEAFAGVDENNIRDMFELVEKLGFNYIMNSQSLWGDYDTVSELAICELVRPKNAPYVGVVRYHWNGQVREMQTSARDYELAYSG